MEKIIATLAGAKMKILAFLIGGGLLGLLLAALRAALGGKRRAEVRAQELEELGARTEVAHEVESKNQAKDRERTTAAAQEKKAIVERTAAAAAEPATDEDADRLLGEAKERWDRAKD